MAASLEPGTVYTNLDDAVHAACCLSGLHPGGATVHCTTTGPDVSQKGGEAYRVSTQAVQDGGATWDWPAAPYEPVYNIGRVFAPFTSKGGR